MGYCLGHRFALSALCDYFCIYDFFLYFLRDFLIFFCRVVCGHSMNALGVGSIVWRSNVGVALDEVQSVTTNSDSFYL